MKRMDGGSLADTSGASVRERRRAASDAPLDLKAIRLAVHGWWLGSPLVYKPGVTDPRGVAHELAGTGAVSGTLVVSDARSAGGSAFGMAPIRRDRVRTVLLLREELSRPQVGMAAALAAAEAVQTALDRPCAVRWPWDILLQQGEQAAPLCCLMRVAVAPDEGVTLLDLRLAFGRMLAVREAGSAPTALMERPDWREVLLARVLHLLDGRLRALVAEQGGEGNGARAALWREWAGRVLVPARAMVICQDRTRYAGTSLGLTGDGALRLQGADGAGQTIALEMVDTVGGWGRASAERCAS